MEKKLSNVLIGQTISKFLLMGISFFTAPIFTRLLNPVDYGQLSVFHSWISFSGILIGFQTHQSIALGRIKYTENFNKYVYNSSFISFLSFILFLIIFLIFKNQIGNLFDFPSYLIPLIPINCFCSYCITIYLCKLIQLKEITKNAFISILSAISNIFLSLLFIHFLKTEKYISKIIAETLSTGVIGTILFIIIVYKGGIKLNKEYLVFCLSYSMPLILHYAGSIILNQSDRVMIKSLNNIDEAGIYSIVYTFSTVIGTISSSFASAWEPFYYDYKKNGDKDIKQKATPYLLVLTLLTLGFILVGPEVFMIMVSKSYWDGIKLIPIFAASWFFDFLYTFPSLYAFYNKKTKIIAFISVIGCIFNLAFNYLLIPKFGAFGAAITTLITHVVVFNMHVFNVKFIIKGKDYDYNYLFYLKGIIPVLIVCFVNYILMDFWYIRWILAIFIGVILIKKMKIISLIKKRK